MLTHNYSFTIARLCLLPETLIARSELTWLPGEVFQIQPAAFQAQDAAFQTHYAEFQTQLAAFQTHDSAFQTQLAVIEIPCFWQKMVF